MTVSEALLEFKQVQSCLLPDLQIGLINSLPSAGTAVGDKVK